MAFKHGEDGSNPFKDLKQPTYTTKRTTLTSYFADKSDAEKKAIVLDKLLSRPIVPDGPSVPLTEEEAEVTEEIRQTALAKAKRVKEIIDKAEERIDNLLESPNFNVDLSKKPRVKRAIKLVFGERRSTITYAMYKQALEIRNELNKEESKDVFKK